MRQLIKTLGYAAVLLPTIVIAGAAKADAAKSQETSHAHSHAEKTPVQEGYFDDDQVKARALSDWAGDWQSVYPYLLDGTLDPVMNDKAKHSSTSAGDYRAYYEIGYKTDVGRILIEDDTVTFFRADTSVKGVYETDGHETLTYKKGNRGVRFIFKKVQGDEVAPAFIQFSDHAIAPEKAGHYHLYWGNDRAALLEEVTNWPTYYPANLDGKQIAEEMLAH